MYHRVPGVLRRFGDAAFRRIGVAAGRIPLADQARVDVASAAGTSIGAAASENLRITGTTTITAFDSVAAGIRRVVTFADELILTHNATSLILPSSANIVTATNDVAEFLSLGSGNWICLRYQRANGVSVSAFAPRTMQTPTGTEAEFLNIPETAKRITIMLDQIGTDGPNETQLQLGTASAYETSGYTGSVGVAVAGTVNSSSFSTAFQLNYAGGVTNELNGICELCLLDKATNRWAYRGSIGHSNGSNSMNMGGGAKTLSGTLTRIKLLTSGVNNFDNGNVSIGIE